MIPLRSSPIKRKLKGQSLQVTSQILLESKSSQLVPYKTADYQQKLNTYFSNISQGVRKKRSNHLQIPKIAAKRYLKVFKCETN